MVNCHRHVATPYFSFSIITKNSDMSVKSSEDLKAVDNSETAVLCSNLEA